MLSRLVQFQCEATSPALICISQTILRCLCVFSRGRGGGPPRGGFGGKLVFSQSVTVICVRLIVKVTMLISLFVAVVKEVV